MKKLLFTLLVLAVGAPFACAQIETPTPTADWKTFAPANEEFSVEVPVPLKSSGAPEMVQSESRVPDKNAESRRYFNSLDGAYFYIFSDDWKTPGQFKLALNFAYDQNQLETAENSGELTTKKFEFLDRWNFYHVILTVSGVNRVYVFHAFRAVTKSPLAERFFNSVKINGKSVSENSSSSKTEKSVSVTIQPEEPNLSAQAPTVRVKPSDPKAVSGTTAGQGNGTGIGNGGAAENQTPTATPTPNGANSGVKILSKPRANYTDYARFYEISGRVLLRVTFSSGGRIGAISTMSGLPFGLTEQAAIAARGITFEPAMRAGIAYSVTKPVEYLFTIY